MRVLGATTQKHSIVVVLRTILVRTMETVLVGIESSHDNVIYEGESVIVLRIRSHDSVIHEGESVVVLRVPL